MFHRRSALCLFFLCLPFTCLLTVGAFGQIAPAAPAVATPLATALAGARPPEIGAALCVSAEQVSLPQGATAPAPGATVAQVADAYRRLVRHFGNVTALAPPMMTVLNSPTGPPNIYAGMGQGQVFTLLAASLSDVQWKTLIGERGLGLSDLTGDDQRAMFAALFPGGTLKLQPDLVAGQFPSRDTRDVSAELSEPRLRLAERVQLLLQAPGGGRIFTTHPRDPSEPRRYSSVSLDLLNPFTSGMLLA